MCLTIWYAYRRCSVKLLDQFFACWQCVSQSPSSDSCTSAASIHAPRNSLKSSSNISKVIIIILVRFQDWREWRWCANLPVIDEYKPVQQIISYVADYESLDHGLYLFITFYEMTHFCAFIKFSLNRNFPFMCSALSAAGIMLENSFWDHETFDSPLDQTSPEGRKLFSLNTSS